MNPTISEKLQQLMEQDDSPIAEIVRKGEELLPNGLTYNRIREMVITNHAVKMVVERCGVKKEGAEEFIRNTLAKAQRIGLVVAEDGNRSIMYCHGKTSLYLNEDGECRVITVINIEGEKFFVAMSALDDVLEEVKNVHLRKYKRLERTHKRLSNEYLESSLELNIELAELERKIHKTKSEKVKTQSQQRKEQILSTLETLKKSISDTEAKMRMLSKSIAAINKDETIAV